MHREREGRTEEISQHMTIYGSDHSYCTITSRTSTASTTITTHHVPGPAGQPVGSSQSQRG